MNRRSLCGKETPYDGGIIFEKTIDAIVCPSWSFDHDAPRDIYHIKESRGGGVYLYDVYECNRKTFSKKGGIEYGQIRSASEDMFPNNGVQVDRWYVKADNS